MNKNEMDKFVKNKYDEYKIKYNIKLPSITDIHYTKNESFWARFNSPDLYNRIYILYIDESLLNENKKFIKQILFHEFTHLCDSLDILCKPIEEFKKIMISYSEFHASEREMIERLEETNENSLSLQTEIIHVGILTIESFMNQTYNFMCDDLIKMSNNDDLQSFYYNTSHIYYFYGYIRALHKFKIDYNFKLIPEFLSEISEIQNTLLQDEININKVLSDYITLESEILNKYKNNRLRKFLNF